MPRPTSLAGGVAGSADAAFSLSEGQTRGAQAPGLGQAMAKAAMRRRGLGGGMGGMGIQHSAGGRMMGRMDEREVAQGGQEPERKVRQIGTKTFYWKNNRWVDASVKPEDDAKAIKITQFSDRYFELACSQKAEYNQYFSQAEPVTVKLDGQVYQVDPPAAVPAQ